jgi:hypothetical protein
MHIQPFEALSSSKCYLENQFLPHREQRVSITFLNGINQLIAEYSVNHMKSIKTHCGQNTELLIVKAGGPYSYHCSVKGLRKENFLPKYPLVNLELRTRNSSIKGNKYLHITNIALIHTSAGNETESFKLHYRPKYTKPKYHRFFFFNWFL